MKKYNIIFRDFDDDSVACWFNCTAEDIKQYIKRYIKRYTISIYQIPNN